MLLRRYQMRICQLLHLTPAEVLQLTWWQWEQAVDLVEECLNRPAFTLPASWFQT